MANTGIKETFTNFFKTTTDKTKGILKDQAKTATSDITKKVTDISTKAKSVFGEGSSKSTSILDIFKDKISQFSVPSATESGKIKFETPSVPVKKKTGFGFLKSKKGLLAVGLGIFTGIYFLTKPKKTRS